MTEKLHHPLGASNAERWLSCPGSVALSKSAPTAPASQYAAEGTVAHSCAEELISVLLNPKQFISRSIEGVTHKQDGYKIQVTREMLDAVNVYVEAARDLIARFSLTAADVSLEQQVVIPINANEELFGTLDWGAVVPFYRVFIWDYKHGAGTPVDVERNKQLLYYALGKWLSLPEHIRETIPELELAVIQPRLYGEEPIKRWLCKPDDLYAFHVELIDGVERTTKPNAPRIPDPNPAGYCKYCPAKAICPEYKDMLNDKAGFDFKDVQLPAVATSISIDEAVKYLAVRDQFNEFCDALYGWLTAQAQAGIQIPNHKLVPVRSNREWKDPEAAKAYLEPIYKEQCFSIPSLRSPSQMEDVIKALFPGRGKEMTALRKGALDALAELVEKPNKGLKLAPITDKRTEVIADPYAGFDVVEAEYKLLEGV